LATRTLDRKTVDYDVIQPVIASQPSFNKRPVNPMYIRYTGVIKRLHDDFGIIINTDTNKDVYFRTNGRYFKVGQKVNFSIRESYKGDIAVNIK
jgi:cold shock CspA family protein